MSESTAPAVQSFDLSGGALCLDFVNTWGNRGDPATDRLHTFSSLLAFARQARVLETAEVEALARKLARQSREAASTLEHARAFRESLARLFTARARGEAVSGADLEPLNALLAEACRHQRLEGRGGSYGWRWADLGGAFEAPLWPIARSAADLLTSADLERVRECDAPDCTWLFIDRSRGRSRRWCSMESCGNRAKARRHYHRRHAG